MALDNNENRLSGELRPYATSTVDILGSSAAAGSSVEPDPRWAIVLGDGMRLLDDSLDLAEKAAFELTPTRVVHTPEVTHIRYTVSGRAPLVLHDRGRGSS